MSIDTIFLVLWVCKFLLLLTHLYCLVGCLSMIVWTHAVWDVLHVCCILASALVQRN